MGGIGEEGAGAPVRVTEPGLLEEGVLRVRFGYGWGAGEPHRGGGGGVGARWQRSSSGKQRQKTIGER